MRSNLKESDVRILVDQMLRQVGWDPADKREVETEIFIAGGLRPTSCIVTRDAARPFTTHAPVYDLTAAAGGWSADQVIGIDTSEVGWMEAPEHIRLTNDYFIVRVSGQSMEPLIPNGSFGLFRRFGGGSREGKKVLVWQRGESEPDDGGQYTIKEYHSTKRQEPDGSWAHKEIRLRSLNPNFRDIILTPDVEGEVRVLAEFVAVVGQAPNEDDFVRGYADYVLKDSRGRPLAVVEAKSNAFDPYLAKRQALPYAKRIDAPFIFLTNGELTYFWDYKNDDARPVAAFYSQRDLERLLEMRATRRPLASIAIPDYYTKQGETRKVRPYQAETMRALDHAFELGKRRFLMELPTGTGKTDLICLYLKRLFQAGWAERVLFLVDREQLATQAVGAIQDLLPEHSSYWLKPGMARQEQQITVALLQTMISRVTEYSAGFFDVVIADECHRSIYGAWQAALTRFEALHIGLTATPSNFIERNTYDFYQCKPGEPDFVYRIQDAFRDGYLVPYRFASGITEIIAEGADLEDEHYDPVEFENTWTNEHTNRLMMEEFDKLAWNNYKELAPRQKVAPGKAIVFAITKRHAARLARILNDLHREQKGRYAEVITSDVINPDALIRKFKREIYPMVAVSVGMLDTGFDHPDVLHLVLCRRVRSPILYQQMRGRGARTSERIGKQKFVIYDFFRNHQYFNDSDTDIFAGTETGHISAGIGVASRLRSPRELIELGLEDEWLEAVSYVEVGPEGERIDKKEYVTNWERAIREKAAEDPEIQKVRSDEPLTDAEEESLAQRLNTPKYYFNEENLRRAYREPGKTLVDFIRAALGLVKIKSREEKLEDAFRAWLVSHSFSPEQADYLSLLKNRGIARGKVHVEDLFEPPLSILDAGGKGLELFGESGLRDVVEDLNESVFETALGIQR